MSGRRVGVAVGAVFVLLALTSPVVAQTVPEDPNERPLPSAGLDQEVINGSRVYLDALGTRDPDGRIVNKTWSVRNVHTNETISVACSNCTTTHFTPPAPGRYAASITATDDDGATASDTLYVEVIPARGPDVTILAPNGTAVNETTPIAVRAHAHNASLTAMTIMVDNRVVANRMLDTDRTTENLTHRFEITGNVTVSATARDTLSRLGRDDRTITVNETQRQSNEEYCPNGFPMWSGPDGRLEYCRTKAIETFKGQLADAGRAVNPDTVIYENDSGFVFEANRTALFAFDNATRVTIPKDLVTNIGTTVTDDLESGRGSLNKSLPPLCNGSCLQGDNEDDQRQNKPQRANGGSPRETRQRASQKGTNCFAPCGQTQ